MLISSQVGKCVIALALQNQKFFNYYNLLAKSPLWTIGLIKVKHRMTAILENVFSIAVLNLR